MLDFTTVKQHILSIGMHVARNSREQAAFIHLCNKIDASQGTAQDKILMAIGAIYEAADSSNPDQFNLETISIAFERELG